ncbi:MAG: hypothetical protein KGJ66_06285 [Alphaproteobacteria bacterium]|nr:hypothetical protein [Alphaproteobacteria bacterium]
MVAALLSNCSASGGAGGGSWFAPTSAADCQLNQSTTTTGALIGAGAGAVAGGLAAGLSGQNGGAAAAIVVGAAAIGALVGTIVAHEHDKACHQLALQQALDLAMAQNDELQRQQEANQQAAEQQAVQETTRQLNESQKTSAAQTSQGSSGPGTTPEYMTVAWADKMTNNSGAITPIANISDASSKQVCMTFDDTQTIDGQTKTVTGKACRGPKGDWQPI